MHITLHMWFLTFCCCCLLIKGYINVRLEDELCALGAKNASITLLEDQESAAIITQQWNSEAASHSRVNYHCEFLLFSTIEDYLIPRGIYVAITHLKLRKNPKTNECLDYIQFHEHHPLLNDSSERICELPVNSGLIPYPLVLDYNSLARRFEIHIDNNSEINEPLELRMVVTAHTQCLFVYENDFHCDPNKPFSCISPYFVNDNITNCMSPCRDEVACFLDTIESNTSNIKNATKNNNGSLTDQFPDDQLNCPTVTKLEEKLKENAELLHAVMRDNQQASLSTRIDVTINDKEKNVNTKKRLKEKLELLHLEVELFLKFIKELMCYDRLYTVKSQIQKYQMDLHELFSK